MESLEGVVPLCFGPGKGPSDACEALIFQFILLMRYIFYLVIGLSILKILLFFLHRGAVLFNDTVTTETKPHYQAILVVLASTNAPFYRFCRRAWLMLAESVLQKGIRVVLLYGLGSLNKDEETPFDLIVNFTDSNPFGAPIYNVQKTLLALPILIDSFSFDFLVRTNIHTFWDAKSFIKRLAFLPRYDCLAGHKMGWVYDLHFVNGIDFIISSDLVQPMVDVGLSDPGAYESFAEDIAMSVIVHGFLAVPILDSWYGEPNGKGPIIFFISPGLEKTAVCTLTFLHL